LGVLQHAMGRHEMAHEIFSKTTQHQSESTHSFDCRVAVCMYCLKQACIRLDRGESNDLVEQFLLEARELNPRFNKETWSICQHLSDERIDLVLTRLYLCRNKPDKATRTIDSIPRTALKAGSDQFLSTFIKFSIRIARIELEKGLGKEGYRRIERVSPIIEKLKDDGERAQLRGLVSSLKKEYRELNKKVEEEVSH
ncbi:MAG: hypothetical protein K2Z81_20345, partial [Cyanobacteria bacterium]|nr:hypothetical protein [Cyanobacteriota bacterium]